MNRVLSMGLGTTAKERIPHLARNNILLYIVCLVSCSCMYASRLNLTIRFVRDSPNLWHIRFNQSHPGMLALASFTHFTSLTWNENNCDDQTRTITNIT